MIKLIRSPLEQIQSRAFVLLYTLSTNLQYKIFNSFNRGSNLIERTLVSLIHCLDKSLHISVSYKAWLHLLELYL